MACLKCNKNRCSCREKETNIYRTYNIPTPGSKGDRPVQIFAKNSSASVPPAITQVVNPPGWSTQPPTLSEGEYRWMSIGYVNSTGEILTQPWSVPVTDAITVDDGAELTDDIFI